MSGAVAGLNDALAQEASAWEWSATPRGGRQMVVTFQDTIRISLDQVAGEPIDQHVRTTSGLRRIAGYAFLIDDVGAERDAIGDVVVKVRMIRHRFRVARPYRLGTVDQDRSVGCLHDDVQYVEAQAPIHVVGVVGVDRRLDD